MERIKVMFEMQQALNDDTNGIGWENGVNKNGKTINWQRCIMLEGAELIESYPWKHWKDIDADADYANIKVELVDIWHFVMSEVLRKLVHVNTNKDMNVIMEQFTFVPSVELFLNNDDGFMNMGHEAQIESCESLIRKVMANSNPETILDAFFDLAILLGVGIDELHTLYLGKNILNKFRQVNGYKDGSYIKTWNGVEDNVIMLDIIKGLQSNGEHVTVASIGNGLQDYYNKYVLKDDR